MFFVWIVLAVVVVYLWLRGGWMTPLGISMAYFVVAGMMLQDGFVGTFLAMLLFIWAPFIGWRMSGRRAQPILSF